MIKKWKVCSREGSSWHSQPYTARHQHMSHVYSLSPQSAQAVNENFFQETLPSGILVPSPQHWSLWHTARKHNAAVSQKTFLIGMILTYFYKAFCQVNIHPAHHNSHNLNINTERLPNNLVLTCWESPCFGLNMLHQRIIRWVNVCKSICINDLGRNEGGELHVFIICCDNYGKPVVQSTRHIQHMCL